MLIHASAVAVYNRGLIIAGDSGSGKSSLAVALIQRGAILIGDDYLTLSAKEEKLYAHAHVNIAGLIECSGLGVYQMPYLRQAQISCIVTLGEKQKRLPEIGHKEFLGVSIPHYCLEKHHPVNTDLAEKALYGYRLDL